MARMSRTPRRQQGLLKRPAARLTLRAESLEPRRLLASDMVTLGETIAIAPELEIDSLEVAETPTEVGEPHVELIAEPGDFNESGKIDADDIDLLAAALRDGAQTAIFDIDGSGSVDKSDMDMLIHDILQTQYGDANLDHIVNGIDYAIWSAVRFQQHTGWATADFNGDGVTDVSDFNIWNGRRDSDAQPTGKGDVSKDVDDSNGTLEAIAADHPATSQEIDDMARVPRAESSDDPQPLLSDGDFNEDEKTDAADIDVLAQAIREDSQDLRYDLDSSGAVNKQDMDMLVRDIVGTEYGDANLDFTVTTFDRAIWEYHRFQHGTGWASGDFNGDGRTDVSDFNVWNSHRQDTQPQPTLDNKVPDVVATIRPALTVAPSAMASKPTASQPSMRADETANEKIAGSSIGASSADRLRGPRKLLLASHTKRTTHESNSKTAEQVATSQPAVATIDGVFARFRRLRSLKV